MIEFLTKDFISLLNLFHIDQKVFDISVIEFIPQNQVWFLDGLYIDHTRPFICAIADREPKEMGFSFIIYI